MPISERGVKFVLFVAALALLAAFLLSWQAGVAFRQLGAFQEDCNVHWREQFRKACMPCPDYMAWQPPAWQPNMSDYTITN